MPSFELVPAPSPSTFISSDNETGPFPSTTSSTEAILPAASNALDVEKAPSVSYSEQRSDPFGSESDDASVKYRTMSWFQCGMIMIAETISLGILSLPSVLAAVGMVP